MRQQTHEYIPPWVTQREQLSTDGWYRICGTIHSFGILLYGGSISFDGKHSLSVGSWVVSYGYWNGASLELMFVAPFSLSPDTTKGYERTHYCAGQHTIRYGMCHPELDKELESVALKSWMFITAENPYSQYTPSYNQDLILKQILDYIPL